MCRALRLLCAASSEELLAELRRGAASADWELVGGARSLDELIRQAEEWGPDVVVLHAGLGAGTPARVRAVRAGVRVISVGALDGADEVAPTAARIREAVLGLPRPGGPVRT